MHIRIFYSPLSGKEEGVASMKYTKNHSLIEDFTDYPDPKHYKMTQNDTNHAIILPPSP